MDKYYTIDSVFRYTHITITTTIIVVIVIIIISIIISISITTKYLSQTHITFSGNLKP